jgi:hypothetical protein
VSVLVIMDIEGATVEQYDHVDRLLGGTTADHAPAGLISHTAGATDTGFFVADVWESPEALQAFSENTLAAHLQTAGVPEVRPRIVPVHNHLVGRGSEAGTIVIVEIAGLSAEDYDRITADLAAHSGDGSGHPGVSHVAGAGPDGLVIVDVWGSEEEFGRFAQAELAPRAGDRMSEDEDALREGANPRHREVAGERLGRPGRARAQPGGAVRRRAAWSRITRTSCSGFVAAPMPRPLTMTSM